jgi:hypothetical protein
MIAFFLTMPISRMMPMMAITVRSSPAIINASMRRYRPSSVERIVMGCTKLS